VQATAARMSQETVAAQDMLTHFAQWQRREPESVAADTTYGNGEFLQWLADRSITPYMRTRDCYNGNFTNCATTANITLPITRLDVYSTPANGKTSLSETYYSSGLLTQDKEYDYGINTGGAPTGTPLTSTLISYASLSNNIINRPACMQVTAGSPPATCGTMTSNTKSLTTFSNYDSYGNVRTITRSVSSSLTRSFTYYSTGLLNTATDTNGTQATYGDQDCNNTPAIVSTLSSGGLSQSYTWSCDGGVVTKYVDPNQHRPILVTQIPFGASLQQPTPPRRSRISATLPTRVKVRSRSITMPLPWMF
jgi:hypothetical protein